VQQAVDGDRMEFGGVVPAAGGQHAKVDFSVEEALRALPDWAVLASPSNTGRSVLVSDNTH